MSDEETVYVPSRTGGGGKVKLHSDPDCSRLTKCETVYPHAREAFPANTPYCSYCTDDVEAPDTGPNGPWEDLEEMDADDLVTDGGQVQQQTARSERCSACGLRYTGEHECPGEPEYHGQWEWDAEHYNELAVRISQGGGCIMWFRKLHSSGPTGWHKLVTHPDGSPRDHWLCNDGEFFAAYVRAVEATVVPVGESPFADQELYDELRERSSQNQAILQLHMSRMHDRYDEAAGLEVNDDAE